MADTMIVTTPACPGCGKTSTRFLPIDKFHRWQRGALIQDVFPEMSAADRETLKTGWHGECWSKMFGDGDE